jgi:hypothetical protein
MPKQRRKVILETPNRRKRKRRRRVRIILLIAVLVLLLIAAIFGFFRIPALQVKEVVVTGASEIDATELRTIAEEQSSGNHYFFVPKRFALAYPGEAIEKIILERHKEISAVEVRVRGGNKVEIIIEERTPEAVYCSVSCYYFDGNGLVYQEATTTNAFIDYVIFRDIRPEFQASSSLGSHPLAADTFKEIKKFSNRLTDLGLHLKEVSIETGDNMSVSTREGRLVISTKESLEAQYEFLKTALSQSIFKNPDGSIRNFGYIDLRFGKKIFYKLKTEPVFAAPDVSSSTASTSAATSTLIQ